jgi:hypothetical protein
MIVKALSVWPAILYRYTASYTKKRLYIYVGLAHLESPYPSPPKLL